MGTMTKNSCDYSDYANAVASSIADGTNDRGILICRSGIGMSIAANRWVGVRAALCRTAPAAALSRQHNDSNLLCLASAYVDNESVEDVLDAWLHADFEGGRHERRVVKSSGSPLQWTDPELAALIQEEGRRLLHAHSIPARHPEKTIAHILAAAERHTLENFPFRTLTYLWLEAGRLMMKKTNAREPWETWWTTPLSSWK